MWPRPRLIPSFPMQRRWKGPAWFVSASQESLTSNNILRRKELEWKGLVANEHKSIGVHCFWCTGAGRCYAPLARAVSSRENFASCAMHRLRNWFVLALHHPKHPRG